MISSVPAMNRSRLRQTESGVYAPATRTGSLEFQASSAAWTLASAPASSKGGSGGREVTTSDHHDNGHIRSNLGGEACERRVDEGEKDHGSLFRSAGYSCGAGCHLIDSTCV